LDDKTHRENPQESDFRGDIVVFGNGIKFYHVESFATTTTSSVFVIVMQVRAVNGYL